jgi:hypothetical protein
LITIFDGLSYFASVTIAATVLTFASLTSAPLFASDLDRRAEIQKVVVLGTHPLNASVVDLAKHGYGEQEYNAGGMANRYRIKNPLDTATIIDGGHPYKTRIAIRKPSDPRRFNGTAVVEWYYYSFCIVRRNFRLWTILQNQFNGIGKGNLSASQ